MPNVNVAIQDFCEPVPSAGKYEVKLIGLDQLRPTEHCNAQRAVSLARKIGADDAWTVPLWVEKTGRIVMDGHHRLEAARALGLSRVPCLLLSYDMPEISVVAWDGNQPFPPSDILAAGLSGRLLAYKTTRHRLAGPVPSVTYAMNDLR